MWDNIIQSQVLSIALALCGAYLLAPQIFPGRFIEKTANAITRLDGWFRRILATMSQKIFFFRELIKGETITGDSITISETVTITGITQSLISRISGMWWVGLVTATTALSIIVIYSGKSIGLEISFAELGIVIGIFLFTQLTMIGFCHLKPMLFFGWFVRFTAILTASIVAILSDDKNEKEKIEKRCKELAAKPTSKWEPILYKMLVVITAPTVVCGAAVGIISVASIWVLIFLLLLTRGLVEGHSKLASWSKRIGSETLLGILGFSLLVLAGFLQILQ